MKLTTLGSNQTQLELSNGTQVLFSYNTPVAAFSSEFGWIKTDKYHSKTTSKHINAWVNIYSVRTVPQEMLDDLVK